MNNDEQLDFNTVLATSVHDMKNSLFMLLQSIEQLNNGDNLTAQQHQSFADLHYQTSRINGGLMQLLALYREERNQLPMFIEENPVIELVEDVVERNRLYLNSHNIDVNISVSDELYGYFDADLVTYLLADVFVNALRHTKSFVNITAFYEQPYLNIKIEDDGEGYPDHMLDINEEQFSSFNACKGRSGLGLLFAKTIAEAHKANNLTGHILLENRNSPSGSIFTLKLP